MQKWKNVFRRISLLWGEFDDTLGSTLTYPSITTIHQPVQEMCEYAIEAIVKK